MPFIPLLSLFAQLVGSGNYKWYSMGRAERTYWADRETFKEMPRAGQGYRHISVALGKNNGALLTEMALAGKAFQMADRTLGPAPSSLNSPREMSASLSAVVEMKRVTSAIQCPEARIGCMEPAAEIRNNARARRDTGSTHLKDKIKVSRLVHIGDTETPGNPIK